jgi:hypothetical protein
MCFSLLLKSNITADLSNHSFLHLYLFSEIIKSLLNDVRRNIEFFFYICVSVHHQSILSNNQCDAALSSRICSSLQGYYSEIDSRPWTSFNGFKPHRHMNCTYDCMCSFNCTPDDGCRKHPKHVE